jgi:hypothetical protein
MQNPLLVAVTDALPATPDHSTGQTGAELDLRELQAELDAVAAEAAQARMEGTPLSEAVRDPSFPALREFHQGLRDALFVEIPRELTPWVEGLSNPEEASRAGLPELYDRLYHLASREQLEQVEHDHSLELQVALAELLIFESVRLRLLMTAWSSPEFESLGGDESDVDDIAWGEVVTMLGDPALADPSVRPLAVMVASASVALAHDAAVRADALRVVGEDQREKLRLRAKLRAALRELRLPEAVLLENALASLTGEDRVELTELQAERPVALAGLSRQAMDQRVSRGRRALTRGQEHWPHRRRASLYDMLKDRGPL